MHSSLIDLLEEIRAIAQLGLNYTEDDFDRDRYERLLQIAAQQYTQFASLPAPIVHQKFTEELGHITPKVGVAACIFDDQQRLLLVQRTDDNTWCLPCGWTEVRETPQQSLAREVREETGLLVEVGKMVRLGTRMPGDFGLPHTTYHLQFHCTVVGGQITTSHETSQVGYHPVDDSRLWHLDHREEADAAMRFLQGL